MSEQPVTHPAAAVPAPIAPAAPHVPSALAAAPQSSSKPEITPASSFGTGTFS